LGRQQLHILQFLRIEAGQGVENDTVSRPSLIASGIWVSAKMPANLANDAVKPPIGSGNAQANWAEVVT
jgi:hypothetical protein